jgi:hypothetical protein
MFEEKREADMAIEAAVLPLMSKAEAGLHDCVRWRSRVRLTLRGD